MTLNEMRCIYPSYAEKERLLREQAEWAEQITQRAKNNLEEARRQGIINDERSDDANGK